MHAAEAARAQQLAAETSEALHTSSATTHPGAHISPRGEGNHTACHTVHNLHRSDVGKGLCDCQLVPNHAGADKSDKLS